MSEQEAEVKPNKQVDDAYLKGYRAGFSRAYKKYYKAKEKKENKLEIQVKKEDPPVQENKQEEVKQEPFKAEIVNKKNDRMPIITALIIIAVLGLVVWYFVFGRANRESGQ